MVGRMTLKNIAKVLRIRNNKKFIDIIRRKGLEKITIDELVDELVLKGIDSI